MRVAMAMRRVRVLGGERVSFFFLFSFFFFLGFEFGVLEWDGVCLEGLKAWAGA